MKPVLSKKVGWIILIILVFIDSFLNVIRGQEGNPLWQPILYKIGIQYTPIFVPLVLIVFYFLIKIVSPIVKKVDKTPKAEELLLTTLVIVYLVFDLWLISVDFLGFRLIRNFRLMIFPLIAIGLFYSIWAERKLKKGQKQN